VHRGRYVVVVVCVVLTAACSGSGTHPSATATPSSTSSTTNQVTKAPGSEFCQLVAQLIARARDPRHTTGKTSTTSSNFQNTVTRLLATSPPSIKADLQVVIRGTLAINNALATVNYDAKKLKASTIQTLENSDFRAAGARVGTYFQQACDFTP
jgi:hypothetical protein